MVLRVFVDGAVSVLQQRVLRLNDKLDDAGEELEDFGQQFRDPGFQVAVGEFVGLQLC